MPVQIDRLDKGDIVVTITEAAASAGDIITIAGLPETYRILRYSCILSAGTGTTVAPLLSIDPAQADLSKLCISEANPAAQVDSLALPAVPCYGAGLAYHSSNVDAGIDNVITSTYYIVEGWL